MLKKININDLYNNLKDSNTNNNSQQKVLLRLEMSDEWADGGFFLWPESMTHPDDSSTFHACVMSGAITTKALADLVDTDLNFSVSPYNLDEEVESYFVLYENGNEVTNKQKIIKILNSIFKVCYVIDSNSTNLPSWYKTPYDDPDQLSSIEIDKREDLYESFL